MTHWLNVPDAFNRLKTKEKLERLALDRSRKEPKLSDRELRQMVDVDGDHCTTRARSGSPGSIATSARGWV